MGKETINGFDIPLRKLTEEESSREITIERIRDFHYEAGEDFLDTTNEGYGNSAIIFGGWLLHKYPEHSEIILNHLNENQRNIDILCFGELDFLDGYVKEEDINLIYFEFVEFTNQTVHMKKRVNQVLIQLKEYYD